MNMKTRMMILTDGEGMDARTRCLEMEKIRREGKQGQTQKKGHIRRKDRGRVSGTETKKR